MSKLKDPSPDCQSNTLLTVWTKISSGDHAAKYMAHWELWAPFSWSGSIFLAWHSPWASNVSMVGPSSIITQSKWLVFFNSELFSDWDEFGWEFNWKGRFNHVLWFCRGTESLACFQFFVLFFFCFQRGSAFMCTPCSKQGFWLNKEVNKGLGKDKRHYIYPITA